MIKSTSRIKNKWTKRIEQTQQNTKKTKRAEKIKKTGGETKSR